MSNSHETGMRKCVQRRLPGTRQTGLHDHSTTRMQREASTEMRGCSENRMSQGKKFKFRAKWGFFSLNPSYTLKPSENMHQFLDLSSCRSHGKNALPLKGNQEKDRAEWRPEWTVDDQSDNNAEKWSPHNANKSHEKNVTIPSDRNVTNVVNLFIGARFAPSLLLSF